MHIQRKISIDKYVGTVAATLINLVAAAAGKLLHRSHELPSTYRTIAVCKLIGMGSIIQATPLLATLKLNFPDSRILFISTRSNTALLQRIPAIDALYTIDDRNLFTLIVSTLLLIVRFRTARINAYLDLEIYSNFSALLAAVSCARHRFGFFKPSTGNRHGIYTHQMYFNIKAPVARVYLQLATIAGCKKLSEALLPLSPTAKETASLSKKCSRLNIALEHPYIVINPNASDLRIERRWSPTNFSELASRLLESHPDSNVIFIGSAAERPFVTALVDQIAAVPTDRIANLAGKLSLGELLALLAGAKMLVTNDSGPLHCAAALSLPTVALFGPCSPQQYGQMPGVAPIYKNVYCSPCVHEFAQPPCNGDNACMQAISIDEVYERAVSLEQAGNAVPQPSPSIEYLHVASHRPLGSIDRKR